jgi:hypothetical protein
MVDLQERYDIRDHGGLFVLVEEFNKAQDFVHLASDLFGGILDFTILRGNPFDGEVVPVLKLSEAPNWSIWVFPKGRPRVERLYLDLGIKLATLARLMSWPSAKSKSCQESD